MNLLSNPTMMNEPLVQTNLSTDPAPSPDTRLALNPLLDFSGLPRFDAIHPDDVAPAIRALLEEQRSVIARLVADPSAPTWDSFVAPLSDAGERLSRAWGVVAHLHSVQDVPAWRDAYNAMLPDVTRHYAEVGQNMVLFAKFKALAASPDYARLTPAQARIVDNNVRDFRLSGADLPETDKPRFREIAEELAGLAAKFSENLLDATNAHEEWVEDAAELAGIPDDVVAVAHDAATRAGRTGWKFTLHMPSYLPVMQYADRRALRARLYRASATRASEFGKPEWDNGPLIDRILALRSEEARMLGYAHYAELSLVPKMAHSAADVLKFLRELAARARPYAERDLAELRSFAMDELDIEPLESWDQAYAAEKLKQARYSFSDEEIKRYLPEPKVLEGLFRVIEGLFGVRMEPDEAPVWHPDARFFRLLRGPRVVGHLYMDLYARDTKRGGAWMDEARTRRRIASGVQTPVAYINCNFSAPVAGQPARFTHDEVITLFHECGHALHHLLSEVDELAVSGIHGVEWDAVELPSQFMENFCWDYQVLAGMSAHAETGEPLPRALFERMLAARNFHSGLQTLRQIEFALFDLRLHAEYDPRNSGGVLGLLDEVRREVAVVTPPTWNRFPMSFSHIFAGGYAAGYYSYKWAEVLSADAFAAFEEAGAARGVLVDRAMGERFMKEILATGGTRPAIESFRAFRGREPTIDALLRHHGMVPA